MIDTPFTHEDVQTYEDLDRLDKNGLIAFLRSDRDDKILLWREWRNAIHLIEVDLKGADLSGAHLQGATFHDAHLEGANLSGAHLEGANFRNAHLEGAVLRVTHLEEAILSGVRLDKTSFNQAHLERAFLVGAHLEGADLCEAHLERADLRGAHLEDANLHTAHLEEASLSEAHLEGATLLETHLERANLREAHLEGAVLPGTHLEEANLYKAHLEGASLDDANLARANLWLAHLRDTALSALAIGGLNGVRLYRTYFWGVLSLRYEQFLENEDHRGQSTIWEHTEGRFSEARDIYKTLKGYFEDAGDYGGANWAYQNEKEMEKLAYAPAFVRQLYPRWKWEPSQMQYEEGAVFWEPNTIEWLRLELADKLAGYGLSLTRPLIWLAAVILGFALIYYLGGMITDIPGCEYPNPRAADCRPGDFLDALVFSISAMTTVDSGTVQPYLSNVSLAASVEALLGIALTGLFGFVLGNKLRNS